MLAQKKVDPEISLPLTDKIRLINRTPDLSKGAKLLVIELVIASNWRGYCWHSVAALGEMISSSETQIHTYLKELETKGFIKIVRRPGTTNRYYLGPIFISDHSENPVQEVRNSEPKKEIKYKTNVNSVIFKSPKTKENDSPSHPTPTNHPPTRINLKPHKPALKPFNMSLVKQILDITNDKKSTGCYIKIVRDVPESTVHLALSSLKLALTEEIVSNRGAYFVQTIKNHHPDIFGGPKTSSVAVSTSGESIVSTVKKATEPVVDIKNQPASPEIALDSIRRIRMMLNKQLEL